MAARVAAASTPAPARGRARASARRNPPPLEHRILMTATLCLLAFGAVMVYSASSPLGVLGARGGNGTGEFVRYVVFGGIGLGIMHVLERRGLTILDRRLVRTLLIASFVLLVLVLAPGLGVRINGAKRWFAAGPIQFQPSEVMKIALVLYVARYLADNPRRFEGSGRPGRRGARPSGWQNFRVAIAPIAVVAGPACLLIVAEPDLGTTLVIAFTIVMLLVAAGMRLRYLAIMGGVAVAAILIMALAQPYQMARLTSFINPWASKSSAGFQAVQGQIALGSGGLLGVGLGKSVQKIYYLPEAQTDFILAVIGEELGVLGITGVVFLYGMIAYAGLRTARRAAGRHAKLLATGLTSLILCQGILNIFVVLGLAPLTGVPLPFISYAPTNLCVMLASVGVLLNISRPGARRLKVVDEPPRESAADREKRRRERGARRSVGGDRRRAG
jgi:cell division protein FtsW